MLSVDCDGNTLDAGDAAVVVGPEEPQEPDVPGAIGQRVVVLGPAYSPIAAAMGYVTISIPYRHGGFYKTRGRELRKLPPEEDPAEVQQEQHLDCTA